MAGSPSTVKYSAGRSGVALAKTNWCASVVLPLPGAPAMMLNENSGRPPPTNSSRPGTPVESLLIFTLSWILTHFSHVPNFDRQNFRLATHCVEGLTSKLRQERCEVVRGSGR